MTQIALLHHGRGTPPGVLDAAARLRADGHAVRLVHLDGARDLVSAAVDAVADLPDGFVAAGFPADEPVVRAVAARRSGCDALLLPGDGEQVEPAWQRALAFLRGLEV
jgi:hypothetical protein